ncbi:hypothetical protein VII00023_19244 [Vibrio ichthyoenteri ATCC 700023]|uniref:Uncharacterized protein n=1 Tax=Vibrio ichthyoenteri ATCC 700023 TaxID=870968 RepID=F9S379_9VIBR|nr:hypothetical protein VII00023_19244 [Vibrio ichthyoenteri ATCC 700023]
MSVLLLHKIVINDSYSNFDFGLVILGMPMLCFAEEQAD